ncbi:hypothetical protein V425_12295 [Lactococcus lactis RTB018]|nr:hypothetical protein V425_12295 [Lactococcus lactis RTB018]
MNIKEYVYVSLLTAAAVVMGIIESSLPPFLLLHLELKWALPIW